MQKSQNLENYLRFLEKLNLKMRNKQSFKHALLHLEREGDAFMQQNRWIHERFVLFMPQKKSFKEEFIKNVSLHLKFIDEQPHQARKYLENLIYEEKQKDFFRRKSGQITFQIRAQMFVVCGMYIVMSLVQMAFFGSMFIIKYTLYSLPLICISFLVARKIQRGFKWKV